MIREYSVDVDTFENVLINDVQINLASTRWIFGDGDIAIYTNDENVANKVRNMLIGRHYDAYVYNVCGSFRISN